MSTVPRTLAPGTGTAVAAAAFGPALAERLAAPGARFLHLCRVPALPEAADLGEAVVAFHDSACGVAWLACAAADRPARPSAAGVAAALAYERVLEGEGVTWAEPAPEERVLGRGVFTFPLGPVRGDVAESVGWRLEVMGDEVLGLRLRFGYKRRHLEAAMGAAGPQGGPALAERVTGTSPVAHALALALAWEDALGLEVPAAATHWRGVLAELERLYSHLGDLAALANATGLPAAAAELFILKEEVLRVCGRLTGHRYQRGAVRVGGLGAAPAPLPQLPAALASLLERFLATVAQLDGSTSFLDRLHTAGRVGPAEAAALRPVGPVGRACGLDQDVRRDRPYGPYAAAGAPHVAAADRGDAWARYRVRVDEVAASVGWLLARLAERPDGGPLRAGPPLEAEPPGVAVGRVEAPRGETIYFVGPGWVRLRPASFVNWAVVPAAVAAGNVLQDVPIIDASFSLSVSAFDR
jgi:formate hydrogenlyase subunit 5